MILQMNAQINEVDQMSGIQYENQSQNITQVFNHIGTIEQYVQQTIGDVEDLLDNKFYEQLNHERGAIEELQLKADKTYTTKNTLGIKEKVTYTIYDTSTSNASMNGSVKSTGIKTIDKERIGFEDILTMKHSETKLSKSFSEIFQEGYEFEKAKMKKEGHKVVAFKDYVSNYVNAGRFDHTVDKGWKNWASTALDAIGIVSFVSMFTGNDFITQERYTSAEKNAADLNVVFSLVGFASLGIGKGVQLGGKALFKYIGVEMSTSVAMRATTTFLDEMGAPKWIQDLTAVAGSIVVSNKIEGMMKSGIHSVDDLANIGIRSVDDLINAGVKSKEDLTRLGIKSKEDLAKLGITKIEDLERLGIKSTDELFKGASGADDVVSEVKDYSPDYKHWNKTTKFEGTKVYQRDDLINPKLVDARGRTNIQRMEKGLAPIGPDGNPINLHHLTQKSSSSIAEITQDFHQQNTKVIHINSNKVPSAIDRTAFNKWRKNYWKNRVNQLE